MDQHEQQVAFQRDLGALVDRYSMEFELSYVGMIGALELEKLSLSNYLFSGGEDERDVSDGEWEEEGEYE